MKATPIATLIIALFLAFVTPIKAQEEVYVISYGKKYLDINLYSLEKYNKQVERQQQRLLKKLSRQESKYASKLKGRDSAAYVRYTQQPISFDSISKLIKPDSATLFAKTAKRTDKRIDSLKAIGGFIQSKSNGAGDMLSNYDDKLAIENAHLNYNQHINDLIGQHTKSLKGISNSAKSVNGFLPIEKNAFYAKERIKAFKELSDEPSKLEGKALEYLQGTEGFDQAIRGTNSNNQSSLADKSATDLEKMGYQTKQQVTKAIQNKLGNSTSAAQEKMGKDIQQWQDKMNEVNKVKNTVNQAKQNLAQAKNINKPSFKINPMRGKPFRKRLEKQFNWQATRATLNGQPAMIQLAGMIGFKHTPSLSYGLGLSTAIGLGQNWNNIHFSFEGLGLRTYAAWQWQYGFGVYVGYERTFKFPAASAVTEAPELLSSPHNTEFYSEAILIGLTKKYRINDKWNGSIQLLYDVWWREKGLRSPLQLRFATIN